MPGFMISSFSKHTILKNVIDNNKCVKDSFKCKKLFFARNTLNKFMDDKAFTCLQGLSSEANSSNNPNIVAVSEGILLNKKDILSGINVATIAEFIAASAEDEGFFRKFRGSFSGAIYKPDIDELLVWTSQHACNSIFYYWNGKDLIVASQVNYILDELHENNYRVTLNEKAFYYMLTYAFMPDASTFANEINRLRAGEYLKLKECKLDILRYHTLKTKETLRGINEAEAIEGIDTVMRVAVKREWEKDIEYGFHHIADLSGGLDARMNNFVAHDLGYENVTNITYCQSGYDDFEISRQMAFDLGHDYYFKQLDDSNFLYDIDWAISMNFGLSLYSGATGGPRFWNFINWDKFGVYHTGMIGDAIISSHFSSDDELRNIKFDGLYSNKLIDRLDGEELKGYLDQEVFLSETRYFQGACTTHLQRRNYTETMSPFLDIDVINYCFSLPIELRHNHYIYKKWILNKYPQAAKYKWESVNSYINEDRARVFVRKLAMRGMRITQKMLGTVDKRSMNPTDYWYYSSEKLRNYLKMYFDEHINNPNLSEQIRKDAKWLYENGNCIEKTQVLTALAACKLYFCV